jgi:1-acyl-sn-glycerol-3-phosphate acyltransferase
MLAEWIIGKISPSLRDRSSLAIVNWAFRCVIFLSGTRVIVKGEENVPKDTAVLYVGNHRSYYDIILTYVRVPRPTGYVAKLEMLRYPLLNVWMHFLHCLFLDRNDLKKGLKTILKGVEKVKSGISICIFPEGTRNGTDQDFLPFHEGSFKIAEKAGAPIVPITMSGTNGIFEDHLPRIKKQTVIIEYGKPIHIQELDRETRKNLSGYVQKIMAEAYHRNLRELDEMEKAAG